MTKLTLAAFALATSLFSSVTVHAAEFYDDSRWRSIADVHWHVWSVPSTSKGSMCNLQVLTPTAAGYAVFGIARGYQDDHPLGDGFVYQESGVHWNHSGPVTVQVAGYEPWTFDMTPGGTDLPELLAFYSNDSAAMMRFIDQFSAGQSMSITTPNGTRNFSLADSRLPLQALNRCFDDAKAIAMPQQSIVPLPAAVAPAAPAHAL
jgi:hypothetical protein